ncbi:MAG TPA: methyltransferase domain-containing protein [Syntrophales bacterium]|nr:methyltransferase domain-containing protein [Syntrophales bacterium]
MTGSDGAQRRDFDHAATSWDEKPERVRLAGDVADAIVREIPLDRRMDCLDLGCGTGLLTLLLAPKVGTLTAADGSRGMLEVLNGKIERMGWTGVKTLQVDIDAGPLPAGPYHLVASSMTLHHIRDIPALLRRVFAVLHPGGRIALADLDAEKGRFHHDNRGVFHFGFDRSSLAGDAAAAGFESVGTTTAARILKEGKRGGIREFTVFLLTARKPGNREGTP